MRRSSDNLAFTLIELLVVISIVAVLAGIILPAVSSVRRSARVATCGNGMRQIAAAGFAYSIDNDGLLPLSVDLSTWGRVWPLFLCDYVGNEEDITHTTQMKSDSVFLACKESATGGRGRIHTSIAASVNKTMWSYYVCGGYGMNWCPAASPSSLGKYSYQINHRLSAITYQSSRVYIGDSNDCTYMFSGIYPTFPNNCRTPLNSDWLALGWKYYSTDPERHQGRMNMAFFDGHVQLVPAASVYLAFYDPKNFK